MKDTRISWILGLVLFLSVGSVLAGNNHHDLQAIKKAVKKSGPRMEAGEAKWFKVLITDVQNGKDKVRITLPLSLMELFIRHGSPHSRIDRGNDALDFKEIFAELKELGPMVMIKVPEDDELIKIWLE